MLYDHTIYDWLMLHEPMRRPHAIWPDRRDNSKPRHRRPWRRVKATTLYEAIWSPRPREY